MTDTTTKIYRGVKTKKLLQIWFKGKYRPWPKDMSCDEIGKMLKQCGVDDRVPIDFEIVELPDGSLPVSLGNGEERVEGVDE